VPAHTEKGNPERPPRNIRNTSDANPLPRCHLIGTVPPPTNTPAAPPPGPPHRHPQCRQPAVSIGILSAAEHLAGLAGQIRGWLAGNGYASAAAFAELDHLMLLVAVRNEAAQAGRGDGPATLPQGWEKMAARLATPAGKRLYARRAALVEPAFAQFFNRFGRYVNYRGRDAVDAEIKLLATVHNLGKLLDHRRRQPALAI
jgi:Transposase DDE domain